VNRRYRTLTDLWHKTAQSMLFAKEEDLDWIASIDTMVYDNSLRCDSMEYDFDMGRDLWLTKARFTVLQRDYLDLYQLEMFLNRCEAIGLGEAKRGVVTTMFAKQHTMREKKYRWGNCMLAWTYRGGNKAEKPTLTMHSRVSYIAYIGGLDLALCRVLAGEIANRVGCDPEDFAFRWQVDSLQFHGFKSIPYLFRFGLDDVLRDETDEYPSARYPTLKLVRRWWHKMVEDYENGKPLEHEKYGPLRRIKKRYAEFQEDRALPSVPIEELSFARLRERG
jgi:hypothetical protein